MQRSSVFPNDAVMKKRPFIQVPDKSVVFHYVRFIRRIQKTGIGPFSFFKGDTA